MPPLVADTHLAIWLTEDRPIARPALAALNAAAMAGLPVYISPITAWEIAMLSSRGRITLSMPPERWFEGVLAQPGVRLAPMPPRILIASNFLPGRPPKDPADRIIAATARDLGAMLMTRDRLLLAYADEGHIRAIAC